MTHPLIYPMFTHVVFTAFLYVILTAVRAPSIWGIGKRPDGSNPWADIEPRISRNLSNQFEWPLFFYVACVILLFREPESITLILAWVFIGGRFLHSTIQILTTNVRLRGIVFTINFLAVLGLWVVLGSTALNSA